MSTKIQYASLNLKPKWIFFVQVTDFCYFCILLVTMTKLLAPSGLRIYLIKLDNKFLQSESASGGLGWENESD